MTSIRSILMATDFSFDAHRAAQQAALLSNEHSARLKLLHVLSAPLVKALQLRLRASANVEQDLLAEARRGLDSLAENIAPLARIPIEREGRHGVALEEIVSAAVQSDLLVIGPRVSCPCAPSSYLCGWVVNGQRTTPRAPQAVAIRAS
jgi:Universal stress protein family